MILLNWKLNHHCNCSRPLTVSLYLPFSELRHNWLINVMAIHVYPPFPFYCYLLFWMDGGMNERRVLYCTAIAAHDAKINLDNSISEGRTCSRPRKTGSVFVGQQSEDFNKRERLAILIRWGEWITSSDFFVSRHPSLNGNGSRLPGNCSNLSRFVTLNFIGELKWSRTSVRDSGMVFEFAHNNMSLQY